MKTYNATEAWVYPTRYSTADFHRLTNRSPSSPRSPAPRTHAEVTAAERTSISRHGSPTADKRPVSSRRTSVSDIQRRPSNTKERQNSYSSVKEDGFGTAQSFFETSIHGRSSPVQTEPDSDDVVVGPNACTCCCRCGRIREWRPNGLRGKRRSRSYSPLRTNVFEVIDSHNEFLPHKDHGAKDERVHFAAGEAPLERLPVEILDRIIAQLALDIPPAQYTPRNVDLVSCLLTSRTIHAATITTLYSHVTVPHSLIFSKFLEHITQFPALGHLIKRLDLSHFTSVGMGRTRRSNFEIQNLTTKTLLRCLDLVPRVQEVLLQEHLDDDMDEAVLRKVLFGLPNLRALDLCASSSAAYVQAFKGAVSGLVSGESISINNLRRLSLHECFTLPSPELELLLSQLPSLTHLDLCHTRVTDKALMSIPKTATLTHINLGRCAQITGAGVVDFLASHPAVSALVYLNLACDVSRYRLLWELDIDRLLPSLPSSLRSLNLSGAKVKTRHVAQLLPLTKHLEELGLGFAELSMIDLKSLFVPVRQANVDTADPGCNVEWRPSSLHYLDLTGVASVSVSALFNKTNALLDSISYPLEVIELGDKVIAGLRESRNANKSSGWVVKELGRRAWYVRELMEDSHTIGEPRRSWKMGAMWWGMRKVPMAYGEVGGLYGHYMFKK